MARVGRACGGVHRTRGHVTKENEMSLFKSIGDQLLRLFVADVRAGACVPESGQICGYKHYRCNGTCA
jgi:hypothetical protein